MSVGMTQGRVRVDISAEVLKENYKKICASVASLGVISVLKANAYGLGVSAIAKLLVQEGTSAIAVAELAEAMAIVDLPCTKLILGTLLPDEIEEAIANGFHIPLCDYEQAEQFDAVAKRLGCKALCHIALDTGMSRVGFDAHNCTSDLLRCAKLSNIELVGMFSHFPQAYEGDEGSLAQIELYKQVLAALEANGVSLEWRHIANSDAINNLPEACRAPFTHVRTGINLYGSFDIIGKRALDLKPVLSIKTQLGQVRMVKAGSTIGYGRTYTCPRDMLVGVVAAGYADGLPLALSNRGSLLINGVPCPVLGRVCMDYTMVSLEQVPTAKAGDEVVCIGKSGAHSITIEDWANLKSTHPYEVLCAIGSRAVRNLV